MGPWVHGGPPGFPGYPPWVPWVPTLGSLGTGMAPHPKISKTSGENTFIYRIRYADSHGPHENSTGLKKRGLIAKKNQIFEKKYKKDSFKKWFWENKKLGPRVESPKKKNNIYIK